MKYLFEPIGSSTEFLGTSEQLYKHILFYLDEDSPNISPPLFQGKLSENIFPCPIIALYGNYKFVENLSIYLYLSTHIIMYITLI